MAKTQACILAVAVLLSPAVQVYGRILPKEHDGKYPGGGNFAVNVNDAHSKEKNGGSAYADGAGSAHGAKTPYKTDSTGTGNGYATSNGEGYGQGWAKGSSIGVVGLGNTLSGGAGAATSDSHKKGSGYASGHGTGSAEDKVYTDTVHGDATAKSQSSGNEYGKSTNKGKAAGGGLVKPKTLTGTVATGHTHAKNDADAYAHGVGSGKSVERTYGKDETTSNSDGTAHGVSREYGSKATGSGFSAGAGKAGDTFAVTVGKGTANANNDADAYGDGSGHAKSTDEPYGPKHSDADSDAYASADNGYGGSAHGTGKGAAVTGVKGHTLATTKSDTKASAKDNHKSAWAGSKNTAVLKDGHGTVKASGKAWTSANSDGAKAHADGESDAKQKSG